MKNVRDIMKVVLILLFGLTYSCMPPEWDEHYGDQAVTVDTKIWDAVKDDPELQTFVQIMEAYKMDTIFNKGISYTLFIPNNDALAMLSGDDTANIMIPILENHISQTVFLVRNVDGFRALENLGGKFPLVHQTGVGYSYDLIPIESSSPLHLDGVYYIIADVAVPRPNLYEFTERFSEIIASYIDRSDSVSLDKGLSTPTGFDTSGNTVYDSVFVVVNRFERDFFPVSREFRNKSATFLLFTQEQYDEALDEMANVLGPAFEDHTSIPLAWQYNVLLPHEMQRSLFDNRLDFSQLKDTMISVTGDTVYLNPSNIDADSRYLCSNGLVYTLQNYTVPKHLYVGENRIEGESLIDSIGAGVFAWKPEVTLTGYMVAPIKMVAEEASENAMTSVRFPRNYNGTYTVSFKFTNLFPMKYRFVWNASFRPSGKYTVYVNDVVLTRTDRYGREITEYDTYQLRNSVQSVDGMTRFFPNGNFNKVDFYVENITDYGDVEIMFEYKGTGESIENGFNIDYVALVPAE